MRLRYLAVLPLAATLSLTSVSAAPAFAAHHAPTGPAVATAKKAASGRSASKTHPVKPAKKHTRFAVTGVLTGVDPAASTVTVLVKGGNTARGTSLTVPVATTAMITLDDAVSTLGALPVGAHVAVIGTVSGTVRTATKVNAEDTAPPTPVSSPTPPATPTA
jgi:hypothetical protein